MIKLVRTSTVPISLLILLKGQLKYLSKHFEVIGISSSGKELIELNKQESIRVISVDMQRRISPIKDVVSLIKLYYQFSKEKPHIVHSITPKAGLLCMLAAKFASVPIRMHTFTGLIFPSKSGMLQKILISMDKLLCWAATNVYPEGEGVKKDLINYKITNKPLQVIANGNVNGINVQYFNPNLFEVNGLEMLKNKYFIKSNDYVFCFVGRLVRDKGINELIEAFNRFSLPNVKLLLVGNFEEELDPLHFETLKIISTNPNVIPVGFQEDIRPFLAISNTFVFPSYREGFPNVVLQASAMELPCIVTDINGSNEIISNNINGLIVPAKNVDELYLGMKKILEDSELYSFLKSNSRSLIVEKYEQNLVWLAQLNEYQKLINRNV